MVKIIKNLIAIILFILAVILIFDVYSVIKGNKKAEKDIIDNAETIENIESIENVEDIVNIDEVDLENGVKFATVSETYFDDALFIGDSRTDGFKIYKALPNATYYCNSSFGVYSGFDRTMQYDKYGLITLDDLLTIKQFGKIYISLGINNLGTDPMKHKVVYQDFVNHIMELQPNAIIYLVSNMHVTSKKNFDSIYNNKNINAVNDFMKEMADNEKIFYLDITSLYDDENGDLSYEYSYDDVHISVKHYNKYFDFLKTHAIIR